MQNTDRTLAEYYGQTNEDGIYETLAGFNLSNRFNPIFMGFDSVDAFKTYVNNNVVYTRAFNPLVSSLTTEEQNALTAIKDRVLEILCVSSDEYEFARLDIDALGVGAVLQAKHKTNSNHYATWQIVDPAVFNQLKADNIELFMSMTQFSWVYGKSKDSFLASLTDFA